MKLTTEQIIKAPAEKYLASEWRPLIDFFWDRYNKRYFNQIRILQNHRSYSIRNNCGFLIASIDCILIETLQQYYAGEDRSYGKTHDPFLLFFKRAKAFHSVIKDSEEAGKFAGLIRSALLHQSKTGKESIINRKTSTPILGWIDAKNKSRGFKLNRDKFHNCVYEEFVNLIKEIKRPENLDLRKKFKNKLMTILE